MKTIILSGTTDLGGGDLTLTAESNAVGYVEKIVVDYIDGEDGADITVTNEDGSATTAIMTKTNFGTADATFHPRSACNAVADASPFTNWADKIFVTGKMKIVVTDGGIDKQWKFIVTITDP